MDNSLSSGAKFPRHPHEGARVRHRDTGLIGLIVGQVVSRSEVLPGVLVTEVFVRPIGGGREWTAVPDELELLD